MQEDPACGPLLDAVAIKELFHPRFTEANLVENNGFEEGPHLLINFSHGVPLLSKQKDLTSRLPGRESAIAQVIRTVPHKVYNVAFTVGEAKNNCHGSTMVKAFAAKGTVKTPFKSEGKRNFKTFNFQFKAILYRTRLTFFSSFYHPRTNNYGTHCGPVLDEVLVFPVS
ncbi:Hypothetical predicted protein [Olea europaea subsp. europaea]|uniref:DUF642 domain-containing protein n=1 Tax=Olea europaea subsp. europaea TaxID=158383 RepID=A0A8S0PZM0_OLEEU|nr:Hypothetical predicted protein [Olea europaea subsp. europaea]